MSFKEYQTDEFNTWGNDGIVCPYCGYKQTEDLWDVARVDEDDCIDYECFECGKEFELRNNIEITYTTTCKKGTHRLVTDGVYKDIGGVQKRYLSCRGCHDTFWLSDEEIGDMHVVIGESY